MIRTPAQIDGIIANDPKYGPDAPHPLAVQVGRWRGEYIALHLAYQKALEDLAKGRCDRCNERLPFIGEECPACHHLNGEFCECENCLVGRAEHEEDVAIQNDRI